MAKYDILMSCGHEERVELLGKHEDRRRKIEYFKESGLCKECYKKHMREKAKEEGLIFNANLLPYVDEKDGSILVYVWFSGDTMTYKDAIKSLGGYRWMEREAAEDMYTLTRSIMCWAKIVKRQDFDEEVEKAVSIGAKLKRDKNLFAKVHIQMAYNKQAEWQEEQRVLQEKASKIAEIPKPAVPEILKGHRWNHKIYGKAGNYSIYLDGEKVSITDAQAEELKAFLGAREEYSRKVGEIENA